MSRMFHINLTERIILRGGDAVALGLGQCPHVEHGQRKVLLESPPEWIIWAVLQGEKRI